MTEVLAGVLLVSGLTTEVVKFAQGMQVMGGGGGRQAEGGRGRQTRLALWLLGLMGEGRYGLQDGHLHPWHTKNINIWAVWA